MLWNRGRVACQHKTDRVVVSQVAHLGLQSCNDEVVVTANIRSSPHIDILQGSPPSLVNHDVVCLMLVTAVRVTPCKFVEVWVCKQIPANDKILLNVAL